MNVDLLTRCAGSTSDSDIQRWLEFGFRLGDKGTHTSRTVMLAELTALFAACPPRTRRDGYAEAIIDHNVLGKRTAANRRLTNQRLGEIYGLDPAIPLFRLLRLLWDVDQNGRPLLAMLGAFARDPLLRATAQLLTSLQPGRELVRSCLLQALRDTIGERLNESTLDKVARNVASSWTQSGHLVGRVRKIRHKVSPTPSAAVYALLLAFTLGVRGDALFVCPCVQLLDSTQGDLLSLALDARRLGLVDMVHGGGITQISFDALLSDSERKLVYGTY